MGESAYVKNPSPKRAHQRDMPPAGGTDRRQDKNTQNHLVIVLESSEVIDNATLWSEELIDFSSWTSFLGGFSTRPISPMLPAGGKDGSYANGTTQNLDPE
jgi:hypothetical protein